MSTLSHYNQIRSRNYYPRGVYSFFSLLILLPILIFFMHMMRELYDISVGLGARKCISSIKNFIRKNARFKFLIVWYRLAKIV